MKSDYFFSQKQTAHLHDGIYSLSRSEHARFFPNEDYNEACQRAKSLAGCQLLYAMIDGILVKIVSSSVDSVLKGLHFQTMRGDVPEFTKGN